MVKPSDRKVWCFLGDGGEDEPESMGALTIRRSLDNPESSSSTAICSASTVRCAATQDHQE